jgi:hypothetical protein
MLNKGKLFAERDVYIDYPFEQVMYRWDRNTRTIYRKFYGSQESPDPVLQDNRLFNDAILYGQEISRDDYERGTRSDSQSS